MNSHYTTQRSFYIGIIREAVEEFSARFPGWGTVTAVPSHIDLAQGAMGYGRGEVYQAVEAVERIAVRLEVEQSDRLVRQEWLRGELKAGRITEDFFLSVYYE